MSKEPPGLDVTILGRQFRVACTEDEKPDLLKAVDYLERTDTPVFETAFRLAGGTELVHRDQSTMDGLRVFDGSGWGCQRRRIR